MAQSESNESRWVWLLCLLAAIHVFIFSAAFPFFNDMDEQFHFDNALKFSHGHLQQGLEPLSDETLQYLMTCASPEYRSLPGFFFAHEFPPPPWIKPIDPGRRGNPELIKTNSGIGDNLWASSKIIRWKNYEASQQPLYYIIAGAWWDLGKGCGLTGGHLLYWLRFLNIPFVAAIVWTGFFAARLIFPGQLFFRFGVPAIIAFMPQQAFYSIQNDVLSPLCFGVAFVLLLKFLRTEIPGPGLGIAIGLALAMTFLTKLSNAPLLAVSGLVVVFKTWRLFQSGKLRPALPPLAWLILCAALPIGGWLLWTKFAFGDFSGTAAKLQCIHWTHKPFAEWWHHPIFTLRGSWTFLSELIVNFWQGEFWWHASQLALPVVNAFYVVPTLCFLGVAMAGLFPRWTIATAPQRQALALSFVCLAAGVAFLAFLSIIYDFGDCPNPSRTHPYFVAGRLILGALIPFLLLLLYGINFFLRGVKNHWARPALIIALILFMLISEIITDWSVFQSQYNWFHMPWPLP